MKRELGQSCPLLTGAGRIAHKPALQPHPQSHHLITPNPTLWPTSHSVRLPSLWKPEPGSKKRDGLLTAETEALSSSKPFRWDQKATGTEPPENQRERKGSRDKRTERRWRRQLHIFLVANDSMGNSFFFTAYHRRTFQWLHFPH